MVIKIISFRADENHQALIKKFKTEETMEAWFLARFNEWASREGLNPAFYEAQAQLKEAEAVHLRQKALNAGLEAKKLEIVQIATKTINTSSKELDDLIILCRKCKPQYRLAWCQDPGRPSQIKALGLSIDEFLAIVNEEVPA
jgi:hypothetical protein